MDAYSELAYPTEKTYDINASPELAFALQSETNNFDINASSPTTRPKRIQFTTEMKLEILEYRKTHSTTETSSHFKIHKSMINRWLAGEEKLKSMELKQIKLNSGQKPSNPDAESALYFRALERKAAGELITYHWLKNTMLEQVINKANKREFKGSYSWAYSFAKRYNLEIDADKHGPKKGWKENKNDLMDQEDCDVLQEDGKADSVNLDSQIVIHEKQTNNSSAQLQEIAEDLWEKMMYQ